jgi:hypothetical protein
MAELKTKATNASVSEFLAAIEDDERREACLVVAKIMKKATRHDPKMWGASIVGFGSMRYRYASGRELDWFITGFAPRKNDVTLYIMPGVDRYREQLKSLGKYKSATSCLYIRKLSDIDPSVLREIVEASVKAMRQMEKDGVAS